MSRKTYFAGFQPYPDFVEIDFLYTNRGESFYNFTIVKYDHKSFIEFESGNSDSIQIQESKTYTIVTQILDSDRVNIQILNTDFTRTNILVYLIDHSEINKLIEDFAVESEIEFGVPVTEDEIMEMKDEALKARVKTSIISILGRCPYAHAQVLYRDFLQTQKEIANMEAMIKAKAAAKSELEIAALSSKGKIH